MPAWVLVLLFAMALVCGYLGMDGLDRMLLRQVDEFAPAAEATALLLGQEDDIAAAAAWLSSARQSYETVDLPVLPGNQALYLVLALSKCDTDNLIICAAARRQHSGVITAAKLSDTMYLPVFKEAGIDYILPPTGDQEVMELLKHVYPRA